MENSNKFTLLENGVVHTEDLTREEANEMLERYTRIFDTEKWEVKPSREVCNFEKGFGLMERQKYATRK